MSYYVHGSDTSLYFYPEGVTFALSGDGAQRWTVKLDFIDAEPVTPVGVERADGVVSYFRGASASSQTAIPTYTSIMYEDLWPGVDMVYAGTGATLKYSFVVHPGGDPSDIRLAYRGATDVSLNGDGQIDVTTPAGSFTDDTPYTYQDIHGTRVEVPSTYDLTPGDEAGTATLGIPVGAYDTSRDLVIDPVVCVYAGFIGDTGNDAGHDIAIDAAGNGYVTGYTLSSEATFPVMAGPDLTFNGPPSGGDAFVAKVRADGTGLVYAGYIGGTNTDKGFGIAVDDGGNAYVAGSTQSGTTFPVTDPGPDPTPNGQSVDGFVTKIDPTGTTILYSGFHAGGPPQTIAVDAAGSAYIAGGSDASVPDPVGANLLPYQRVGDAFVAKLNPAGTAYEFDAYSGGPAATRRATSPSRLTGPCTSPAPPDRPRPASRCLAQGIGPTTAGPTTRSWPSSTPWGRPSSMRATSADPTAATRWCPLGSTAAPVSPWTPPEASSWWQDDIDPRHLPGPGWARPDLQRLRGRLHRQSGTHGNAAQRRLPRRHRARLRPGRRRRRFRSRLLHWLHQLVLENVSRDQKRPRSHLQRRNQRRLRGQGQPHRHRARLRRLHRWQG